MNLPLTPIPPMPGLGRVSVLEDASPLALSFTHDVQSARGLAHSKTLRRDEWFMGNRCVYSRSLHLSNL